MASELSSSAANLKADFKTITERLDLDNLELPHLIKGSPDDYVAHYDSKTIDIVRSVFNDEILEYKYEFGM